jgi:protein TonB
VLNFREANGDDSFLVPGDLALTSERSRWTRGFMPVGEGPLGGYFRKDTSRWALWWIPWETEDLFWSSFADLRLTYGLQEAPFAPLNAREAAEVRASLPWDAIRALGIDPERSTASLSRMPDPSSFDEPPEVKTPVSPTYPRFSKIYDFHGSVHVAVRVNAKGLVTDAYVLQSTAAHELNVAALVAAMDWVFRPGKKNGVWVEGEIVIPMVFNLRTPR